jgi:limonene 1,2-monooxygenase
MPNGLRFGVFTGPYHRPDQNPTLSIRRDLELAGLLDDLGFDEMWMGEHHSGGVEIVGSPEIFIAAAAQRTTRIKLGTGVVSLPYHNPFTVADRIVYLDHLTRGRMMFGVGPGQLLKDAQMLGIEPLTQRPRMEEALHVILELFSGKTVTHHSDWFTLQDAVLQLRPFSDFDVVVTSSVSPSGAKLAGRNGVGMLALAASSPAGIELLQDHWRVAETEAQESGNTVRRADWRLQSPVYLAESLDQAIRDIEDYTPDLLQYLAHVNPGPSVPRGTPIADLVRIMNDSGAVVIGTPDMAVEQVARLQEKSGGFGCFLMMGADFAPWPALKRSYELFSQEVIPRFTGQLEAPQQGYDAVMAAGMIGAETTAKAQAAARQQYNAERASVDA